MPKKNIRLLVPLLSVLLALLILTENAVARSTNRFLIGQTITNPKTLQMSDAEIYRKTIGTPRRKAVLESGGDFSKYLAKRGRLSVGGKAFEARTLIKMNNFFARRGVGDRILSTAVEGFPNDVADLVRISSNGEVKELYQLKAGHKAAKEAVTGTKDTVKYANTTIVTHPETLDDIKNELLNIKNKNLVKGKPFPPYWQAIDEAIQQGRLTDQIDGVRMPTREMSINKGVGKLEKWYNRAAKRFGASPTATVSDDALKIAATKASGKMVGKLALSGTILAGFVDIGFGVHGLYDADRRYRLGELDSDIFTGKRIVAVSQVSVGTVTVVGGAVVALNAVGYSLMTAPEPFYTKIAGGVVIVVSVGLGAGDYMLERVQANRTESRRRLLKEIDDRERCRIVLEELRGMMNGSIP